MITMSAYKIRVPRTVNRYTESQISPETIRDCQNIDVSACKNEPTVTEITIESKINPNPKYQTRDYYLRREYIRRRKLRRKRRTQMIAASLAFTLMITAGILIALAIGNDQSAINLDDLTTTIYDEQIHVEDYIIDNAFYCAACIDEPENSISGRTPESDDTEDEQSNDCIICNRAEEIIII